MEEEVLVCGAGGFIGGHLVKRLKKEGFWVRGADLKHNEYAKAAKQQYFSISSILVCRACRKSRDQGRRPLSTVLFMATLARPKVKMMRLRERFT